MPRGPRLDEPGAAHHVMIRGIERRRIFLDTEDYESFLDRLDRLIPELGFRCWAWTLMPNHVHMVLQTGRVPLSRLMARLGTGHACAFNRRHDRVGHLLQNRFKSRPVGDEHDLLGLVLYVHRNPLRAGLIDDPRALDGFPWCGHGTLTGARLPRPFESLAALRLLDDDPIEARLQLRRRMEPAEDEAGGTEGDVPCELALFPEGKRTNADRKERKFARNVPGIGVAALVEEVSGAHGVPAEDLVNGRRRTRVVSEARRELVRRAVGDLGISGRAAATALGLSESAVSRALAPR